MRRLLAAKSGKGTPGRSGRTGEKLTGEAGRFHGKEVRGARRSHSGWLCSLIQSDPSGSPAGQRGDGRLKLEDRFARLYAELRVPVFLYLRRIGLSPEEAEDIAHEVFLRLFIHLLGKGQEENLRGWIYRVAHNLAIDRLKQQRCLAPRSRQEWVALSDLLQDQAPSPEQSLIDQEKLALLERAIRSLPPRQWQCLHLRLEGFGNREIGESLGVTTVSTSMNYALQSIIQRIVCVGLR